MKLRKCRVCGCTDKRACVGGCRWVAADLCSKCTAVDAQSDRNGAQHYRAFVVAVETLSTVEISVARAHFASALPDYPRQAEYSAIFEAAEQLQLVTRKFLRSIGAPTATVRGEIIVHGETVRKG